MTMENTKKRVMDWFKSTNINQEQDSVEQQISIAEATEEEQLLNIKKIEQENEQNNNHIFSKDNQDKVVLDVIVSLENMIKDRQLILYKNKGLEEQLFAANETISRIKQELMKKDQLLQEKSKEIRGLESSLTNKQMSYDQLLEDYKEYQNNSRIEYEKISNQLETEINKYNKLNEESINNQYQSMLKINELEEKVRSLDTENQQYVQQYKKILDEKSELMKTINDFTERMSFSFSQKTTVSAPSDSE